jgi:hypothetical protein
MITSMSMLDCLLMPVSHVVDLAVVQTVCDVKVLRRRKSVLCNGANVTGVW